MLGMAFAGRVAASQLQTLGLPELITSSLEDYEALALALARDPARLAALRARLAAARASSALFDTDRMRQNVEQALLAMARA
jgi:predicted O-linked N-acetylglucosamine transferase (SPINDLY family)